MCASEMRTYCSRHVSPRRAKKGNDIRRCAPRRCARTAVGTYLRDVPKEEFPIPTALTNRFETASIFSLTDHDKEKEPVR